MITIISSVAFEALKGRLQAITLLGSTTTPYAHATIQLRTLSYDTVQPTSLYIARSLLAVQEEIEQVLGEQNLHPLELTGGLMLRNEQANGTILEVGLTPPIIECWDGQYYVLDGSHRLNLGRMKGRTQFTAIVIEHVAASCPMYAYPNAWNEVITYDTPPLEPALRKRYRDNYQHLYRDLGPLNGSTLRPSA
jgi:hypothetical protein